MRTAATPPRHVFAETAPRVGRTSNFERLSQRFLGPAMTHTTSIPVIEEGA